MSGTDDNIIDFAHERRRRGPRFNGGLMQVLEVSRDLVCLCRDSVIMAINGAGVRLLGAGSSEALRGRRLAEFILPEYGHVLDMFLSGRTSEDQPVATRLLGMDQTIRDVELQVFRAREIAPDATVVVGRIVSRALPGEGDAQAVDYAPPPFFILADRAMNLVCHVIDGTVRYLNAAGAAILGVAGAGTLVGHPLAALFHPDQARRIAPGGLAALTQEGREVPMRLMRRDGDTVNALVRFSRVPSRHRMEVMIEARDLGADGEALTALLQQAETLEMRVVQRTRELAEQRALAEERKLAADAAWRFAEDLIDTMPSPIWYKDARGRFETTNRAFREMFGDDQHVSAEFVFGELTDSFYGRNQYPFYLRDTSGRHITDV